LVAHAAPRAALANVAGQPAPTPAEHFESEAAVICHVVSQAATESQSCTGFEPYSHSRPCDEHEALDSGSCAGQGDAPPPSPAPLLPLLAPLLPLLAPLLLPPPLLLPLLAPLLLPLPLLLPPEPLLPPLLPPPLLLPLLPPLLPFPASPPRPASSSALKEPPHARGSATSGAIHALAR
jgi:hypothetical protein